MEHADNFQNKERKEKKDVGFQERRKKKKRKRRKEKRRKKKKISISATLITTRT